MAYYYNKKDWWLEAYRWVDDVCCQCVRRTTWTLYNTRNNWTALVYRVYTCATSHWDRHTVTKALMHHKHVTYLQLEEENERSGLVGNFVSSQIVIYHWPAGKLTTSTIFWIQTAVLWSTVYLLPEFHENPPITFWVIQLTNRQTDRQTNGGENRTFAQSGGGYKSFSAAFYETSSGTRGSMTDKRWCL